MLGSNPNITGMAMVLSYSNSSFAGAFSEKNRHVNMYQGGSGPSYGQIDLMFSASANNSLYSQETVQLPALQTLIIIKA